MKNITSLMLATASLSLFAAPAFAQEIDEDWTGPYIGGSIGLAAQNNDRGEGVEFDTNLDGTYGDTVNTSLGANAFSPGFCGGAANGRGLGLNLDARRRRATLLELANLD